TDTVQSSVSYTLGANVENLTLMGTGTINGTGNTLANILLGNSGDNILNGGAGNDSMNGGEGNDLYVVGLATDHVVAEFADDGATGVDEVRFTATSASTLSLYAGDTGIEKVVIGTGTGATAVISGTTALNVNASAVTTGLWMIGNAGANALTGTIQNDTLEGGSGNDTLTGGSGSDDFVFNTAPNSITNKDTITDFQPGADELQFSKAIFAALGDEGELKVEQFWSSATAVAAHDSDDRIIYNTSTGALYYDADGTGGIAAVQVAIIGTTTHPALQYTDMHVVA
ncbi:MAG: hypothetical protein JZU70_06405, partial [Chlorobium sp.]|nr:hypothetical protein [Chlorobium sp.]